MVVMSIEKYTKLLEEIDVARALELRFGNVDIEKALMKTVEDIKNGNMKYLTHEEVFENARRIVDEKKDI